MLVVSNSGLLQDADASLRDKAKERANKVLDKHIRIDWTLTHTHVEPVVKK